MTDDIGGEGAGMKCERCGEKNPAEIHTCSPQEPLWIRNREGKLELHAPPQREWQGLTDEERNACLVEADPCEALLEHEAWQLMVDIEARLKEKNT